MPFGTLSPPLIGGKWIGAYILVPGGVIQIEASIKEDHSMQMEVTDSAVEDGSDMSDHAHKMPDQLSIDGVFSDVGLRDVAESAVDRYHMVQTLFEKRTLVDICTALRVYKNMMFTNFKVSKDSESGYSIMFNAEMKEIRFSNAQIVIDVVRRPKGKKKAVGFQAPKQRDKTTARNLIEPALNYMKKNFKAFEGGSTSVETGRPIGLSIGDR